MNRLEATTIRGAGESDLVPLKALAATSHRNTRFYRDRSFPTDRADAAVRSLDRKELSGPETGGLRVGPAGRPTATSHSVYLTKATE